jgi:hypothetical protein
VDEEKSPADAFEEQLWRQVEAPVIVAKDAVEWPADCLDGLESLLIAVIAEMPNLIRLFQLTGGGGGEPSVGIGNHGDEHRQILSFKFWVKSFFASEFDVPLKTYKLKTETYYVEDRAPTHPQAGLV